MKIIGLTSLLFFLFTASVSVGAEKHNVKPSNGYVPDAETAIRIAIAVWEPIYGKRQIQEQAPYAAKLNNGVWTVEGSLPEDEIVIDNDGNKTFIVSVGGVALIEIEKDSGRIIRVSHGE